MPRVKLVVKLCRDGVKTPHQQGYYLPCRAARDIGDPAAGNSCKKKYLWGAAWPPQRLGEKESVDDLEVSGPLLASPARFSHAAPERKVHWRKNRERDRSTWSRGTRKSNNEARSLENPSLDLGPGRFRQEQSPTARLVPLSEIRTFFTQNVICLLDAMTNFFDHGRREPEGLLPKVYTGTPFV